MEVPCKQVQATLTVSSRTDRLPRRLLRRLILGSLTFRLDLQLGIMDAAAPATDRTFPLAPFVRRVLERLEELKRLPKGWREGVSASLMETFQLV
jgi:hypothetical protein